MATNIDIKRDVKVVLDVIAFTRSYNIQQVNL